MTPISICNSEEIYTTLRTSLLGRIHDKETPIRVQAVIALSKLSGSEDPADLADGDPSVIDVLKDVLAYDSSPSVTPHSICAG